MNESAASTARIIEDNTHASLRGVEMYGLDVM